MAQEGHFNYKRTGLTTQWPEEEERSEPPRVYRRKRAKGKQKGEDKECQKGKKKLGFHVKLGKKKKNHLVQKRPQGS